MSLVIILIICEVIRNAAYYLDKVSIGNNLFFSIKKHFDYSHEFRKRKIVHHPTDQYEPIEFPTEPIKENGKPYIRDGETPGVELGPFEWDTVQYKTS